MFLGFLFSQLAAYVAGYDPTIPRAHVVCHKGGIFQESVPGDDSSPRKYGSGNGSVMSRERPTLDS